MSDNGHSNEDYSIRGTNHASGLPEGANYGANGGGGNTGKWRGHKDQLFEGGIRVPAMISYPARLPSGIVRDQAITAMDWMPTILDLCQIKLPNVKLDGKTLLPIINSTPTPTHNQIMHWQWADNWAVRQGQWKLIGRTDIPNALGNLNDPHPEKKNYLKDQPEIAERLQALHNDWLKQVY